MNLLPCWIRVLQVLQLSEYFGTLLITIFGMAKALFGGESLWRGRMP